MKQGLTFLIVLLDKSGSMLKIRNDIIGGFNAFIKEQVDAKLGECKVFVYTFDTKYKVIYDGVDINNILPLTDRNYIPSGNTALYDSLGKTIKEIGEKLSKMNENDRPEKVLLISLTDGESNSSLLGDYERFSLEKVKEMITHQTDVYKWNFVHLGSSPEEWQNMGYTQGTTLCYAPTSRGTAIAFDKLSKGAVKYRASAGGQSAKFSFDDNN